MLIRYYLLMARNTAVQEWLDRVAALDLPVDHPTMIRNRIRQAQAVMQTTPDDPAALAEAQQQLAEIAALPLPEFTLMKANAVLTQNNLLPLPTWIYRPQLQLSPHNIIGRNAVPVRSGVNLHLWKYIFFPH